MRRFCSLMLKSGEYNADYPDLFNIQLSNFDHLLPEQQLIVLRHYRGYLTYVQGYLETSRRYVETNTNIPPSELPQILRVIDHRARLNTADLQWVDEQIAQTTTTTGA